MKKFLSFSLLLTVLATGFAITSCGDDDDDKVEVISSGLVGTWKYTFSSGYSLLTFKQDGTGTEIELDDEDHDSGDTFTWVQDGNNLVLIFEGESAERYYIVSVTSTKLVLTDSDGYTITLTRQ